jgi:hypothetical protein
LDGDSLLKKCDLLNRSPAQRVRGSLYFSGSITIIKVLTTRHQKLHDDKLDPGGGNRFGLYSPVALEKISEGFLWLFLFTRSSKPIETFSAPAGIPDRTIWR